MSYCKVGFINTAYPEKSRAHYRAKLKVWCSSGSKLAIEKAGVGLGSNEPWTEPTAPVAAGDLDNILAPEMQELAGE
jgi:hypothetical protein